MHFNVDRAALGVVAGVPLTISDAQGRSLRVLQGRVWVTQEGSLDDTFLDAGQTYTFDGPGSAVVTAEGPDAAIATVVFDVPLSVSSRHEGVSGWLRSLKPSWGPGAMA